MGTQYQSLTAQYSEKADGYYEMERPEVLQLIPDSVASVLEIGCSSGSFGNLIKIKSPNTVVWGIEPNEAAAQIAAGRLDRVICRTFEPGMVELAGQVFDCIVFNDVLEHLVDPFGTLEQTKYLVAPNGYVVGSIPNILFFSQIAHILIKQDWKYQESGILDYTHLRFFTRKSIIRMFEQCGFEILRLEGINPDRRWVAQFFNILTLGLLRDWRYMQFGICAVIKSKNG